MITQALILAAGHGTRMRPLTDHQPKPMVPVMGRPIIDYAIESLRIIGIQKIVANTHYKADVLEPHLNAQHVLISHEPVLLDTGGGINNALGLLDETQPLLVVSGDSILVGDNGLRDLMQAWNNDTMDICLLLQQLTTMTITPGVGDYDLVNGTPKRARDQKGQYMWTSARILHPRIFEHVTKDIFSFLTLMDEAENKNRLGATIHTGTWHHLTTPDDVRSVEAA